MPTYSFTLMDDEYTEVDWSVPGKYEVCGRCRGTGTHDHPAFENGLTQEDFEEDPEFRQEYLMGRYDVLCSVCKGLRVVLVPDEDVLTPEQRAAVAAHEADLASEAQERSYERRRRSMGIEY